MPLFCCRQCKSVENTALSNYWYDVEYLGKHALCAACHPEILRWHGAFKRRQATGMLVDFDGFLWATDEALPPRTVILGEVL